MKKTFIYTALILFCIYIMFFLFFRTSKNNNIIEFSSWGSKSETTVINSAIKEFEKNNPQIKIKFIHIPQNYFQKLHLLFASNLEPDVIFINNQNIKMYINANLLEDLSEYFQDADKVFYKEALDCFKQDGKLYAVPRDISNLVIYYNKDIFKKQNVKMPKKINNIYELKEIAQRVTTNKNFGINYEENPLFWLYYLASNGGGIISDDLKHIIINKKESIDALNLYADMINKNHIIPTKSQLGSKTSAQMFINGELAMYLGGRWMTPKFRELNKFDWDIIEFPAKNNVYIDASGWAISKKSKKKELAAEFIKYLSSKKTESLFAESGLIIPANKEALFQTDKEMPYNYKAFQDMLNNSKPTPINENYSNINDIITEKAQIIFSGKNAQDVFDAKVIKELESFL